MIKPAVQANGVWMNSELNWSDLGYDCPAQIHGETYIVSQFTEGLAKYTRFECGCLHRAS